MSIKSIEPNFYPSYIAFDLLFENSSVCLSNLDKAMEDLIFHIPGVNAVTTLRGGARVEIEYEEYEKWGAETYASIFEETARTIEVMTQLYEKVERKLEDKEAA